MITFFEILKFSAVDSVPQRLEGSQVHQSDTVLEKAFTVGTGLVVIALLIAVGRVRRNVNLALIDCGRDPELPGLRHPLVVRTQRADKNSAELRIVGLSGGDRGFALDRSTRQCRTDLAQELATAGTPVDGIVGGRIFCFGYISDGIFLVHFDLLSWPPVGGTALHVL